MIALITICLAGLLGTGGALGVVDYFAGDLPSIDQLQASSLQQTTRIVDRNGNLIAAVYHENRTVVPLSKISVRLQTATIDTEDRTFYANSGVDYRRLAIAIIYDLTHRTSTIGGSTITQQVVKNNVLDTAEAQSRTISRKFRELVLAEEMERRYTKQQIAVPEHHQLRQRLVWGGGRGGDVLRGACSRRQLGAGDISGRAAPGAGLLRPIR